MAIGLAPPDPYICAKALHMGDAAGDPLAPEDNSYDRAYS